MSSNISVMELDDASQSLVKHLSGAIVRTSSKAEIGTVQLALQQLISALQQGQTSVAISDAFSKKLLTQGIAGQTNEFKAMIIDGDQLYLARYYHYKNKLETLLAKLSRQQGSTFDCDKMQPVLQRLFPLDPALQASGSGNWQKVAASLALFQRFSVISGGPGTGKTTTVLKLLAALYEAQETGGRELQVMLAAPTGKAAARMQESIRANITPLPCGDEIKQKLQALNASTLHRLLGYKHQSVEFRHHAHNPLALDILVVDESSMIDSTMMSQLLDAIPAHARIILLGDKDQLPPVGPGSPFADICAQYGFSEPFAKQLANLSGEDLTKVKASHQPLSDNLVFLQHSFRFDAHSGIGNLARAINDGDIDSAQTLLADETFSDIAWVEYIASEYRKWDCPKVDPIIIKIKQGFGDYLQALKARESFEAINEAFLHFCVLTCIRQGGSGLEKINEIAQKALGFPSEQYWYHGRPIMISKNDYQTKLYNGDVGLCLDLHGDGDLRVYFPTAEGFRAINTSRIPSHETAFTMTVHKSQGSEFKEVLFLLPEKSLPIINKQLVYTAITRAKKRVEIWGNELKLIEQN
ncbi:exodeoxyribonuclease V subunit alpha [Psychromonas sp. MME2]|uniref:exodeoxyribonuclease V subunit alpha n=1 Tax=Psychromonas sp. MME2 TaxID=3231033 RepID=UPI00339C37DA